MTILRFRTLLAVKIFFVFTILPLPLSCQGVPNAERLKTDAEQNSSISIDDGFYQLFPEIPVKLGVPLRAIRQVATPKDIQLVSKVNYGGTLRRFSNEQLNSRSIGDVQRAPWNLVWRSEIPTAFTPITVLEFNETAVLEANGLWLVFDRNGKRIKQGQPGPSEIVLDTENFYAADSNGMIVAHRLSDGSSAFGVSLFFGAEYERTFLFRNGRKLLVVSSERELDPHLSDTKEQSLVELIDLGEPEKVDRDGIISSATTVQHFVRKTRTLLAAAVNEGFLIAVKNRIFRLDSQLQFVQALSGNFQPIAISVDETSRAYLLVRVDGKQHIWRVNKDGELELDIALPPDLGNVTDPPAIGYDHRIVVFANKNIAAFDQKGARLWAFEVPCVVKGSIITQDNEVVATCGSDIVAFSRLGSRRILATIANDVISTAPTLTKDGNLLVAAGGYLYKFAASK